MSRTKVKDSKYLKNVNVGRKTVIFDRTENLKVQRVSSIVGNEYFHFYVFTQGVFQVIDALQLGGGFDLSLPNTQTPVYYGVKDLDTDVFVGMIGGHKTSNSLFRVRAIHAFKPYSVEEFASNLFNVLCNHAKVDQGCSAVWNLIDINDLPQYQSWGFEFYKYSRDPQQVYVLKRI